MSREEESGIKIIVSEIQVWPAPTDSTGHQTIDYFHSQFSVCKTSIHSLHWRHSPACLTLIISTLAYLWALEPCIYFTIGILHIYKIKEWERFYELIYRTGCGDSDL